MRLCIPLRIKNEHPAAFRCTCPARIQLHATNTLQPTIKCGACDTDLKISQEMNETNDSFILDQVSKGIVHLLACQFNAAPKSQQR
jgi:hypothetical protein